MRARRFAFLLMIGLVVTCGITLAAAWHADRDATRQGLRRAGLAVEAAIVPILARFNFMMAPAPSHEEQAIWSAIVEQYSRGAGYGRTRIAIAPMSHANHFDEPHEVYDRLVIGWSRDEGMPWLASAVHEFLIKNERRTRIRCVLPRGSKFVADREYLQFADDRWAWEKFTGATSTDVSLSMSRVGFNLTGTRALLHVSVVCGGMCGSGHYIVLEKRNGTWVPIAERITGIA
ncbi:MAG: hypothetical protein ACTHQM_07205 [Thermoanaerobaculia bacterium]